MIFFRQKSSANVIADMLQGLGDPPQAEMYVPYRQGDQLLPNFQMSLVMRTVMDPHMSVPALRSAIREIDRNQPLVKIRTMEENIQLSVAQPRFRTWLVGIFGSIALVLAAVGVYGVMSYSVTQRTNEMGIRVAMGAQPIDIFRTIVGEGLSLAITGVVLGLTGAIMLSRVMHSFVFGVSTVDPATLVTVGILLTLVGLTASFFPAQRATRVDPTIALRYE